MTLVSQMAPPMSRSGPAASSPPRSKLAMSRPAEIALAMLIVAMSDRLTIRSRRSRNWMRPGFASTSTTSIASSTAGRSHRCSNVTRAGNASCIPIAHSTPIVTGHRGSPRVTRRHAGASTSPSTTSPTLEATCRPGSTMSSTRSTIRRVPRRHRSRPSGLSRGSPLDGIHSTLTPPAPPSGSPATVLGGTAVRSAVPHGCGRQTGMARRAATASPRLRNERSRMRRPIGTTNRSMPPAGGVAQANSTQVSATSNAGSPAAVFAQSMTMGRSGVIRTFNGCRSRCRSECPPERAGGPRHDDLHRHRHKNMTIEQHVKGRARLQEVGAPDAAMRLHPCFGEDGQLQVFDISDSQAAFDEFLTYLGPIMEELGIELPRPRCGRLDGRRRRGGRPGRSSRVVAIGRRPMTPDQGHARRACVLRFCESHGRSRSGASVLAGQGVEDPGSLRSARA